MQAGASPTMLHAMQNDEIKAILFDVFGSVVDWRSSLIGEFSAWGKARGMAADWATLVDAWRGSYGPSMQRVRSGELPWTNLDALQRQSIEGLVVQQGITGLSAADFDYMTGAWHRLKPWPDSVEGLTRLRSRYVIAPLSNGNVALLVNMAKYAALPWDMVFATELFRHYKPDPETYLGACTLLGLAPSQVMMAAAHNYDLHAARRLGLRTCFFARPTEYGPHQKIDFAAESDWDIVAADIADMAARLGC